jgi:hypothetical protein
VASDPKGPYVDKSSRPLVGEVDAGRFDRRESAAGPGHYRVLRKRWFVYHAWDPALVGTDPNGRTMWLSELTWPNGNPAVQPPLKNNPGLAENFGE